MIMNLRVDGVIGSYAQIINKFELILIFLISISESFFSYFMFIFNAPIFMGAFFCFNF